MVHHHKAACDETVKRKAAKGVYGYLLNGTGTHLTMIPAEKRFIEMSNEPGDDDLKERVDQAFEGLTRKYIEHKIMRTNPVNAPRLMQNGMTKKS